MAVFVQTVNQDLNVMLSLLKVITSILELPTTNILDNVPLAKGDVVSKYEVDWLYFVIAMIRCSHQNQI